MDNEQESANLFPQPSYDQESLQPHHYDEQSRPLKGFYLNKNAFDAFQQGDGIEMDYNNEDFGYQLADYQEQNLSKEGEKRYKTSGYRQRSPYQSSKFISVRTYDGEQKYKTETKNLPNFFGNNLRNFLREMTENGHLTSEAVEKFVNLKGSNQKSKNNSYYTIKSFRDLFLDDEGNKLAKMYFSGPRVIQDIMNSVKKDGREKVVGYVKVYRRGVLNPKGFTCQK